jgi:hypothetical protein
MMAALIAGQRNPQVLAQMARTSMRTKIPQLEEAFVGHFTDHHRFLLTKMLARIDALDVDIADLDTQIEAHLAPFADAAARLDDIPRGRCHRGRGDHRRGRPGHDPFPDPCPPFVLGPVRPRVVYRAAALLGAGSLGSGLEWATYTAPAGVIETASVPPLVPSLPACAGSGLYV